jgi:very-short-patch-repair endonuclease
MTQSEEKLWDKLKARKLNGIKFWRQNPTYVYIENSWLERYVIPDFLSNEHKLIIELDWNIHDRKDIYLLDLEKEKLLLNLWYKVIRFKNEEIFQNLESVLQKISTLCSCKE